MYSDDLPGDCPLSLIENDYTNTLAFIEKARVPATNVTFSILLEG